VNEYGARPRPRSGGPPVCSQGRLCCLRCKLPGGPRRPSAGPTGRGRGAQAPRRAARPSARRSWRRWRRPRTRWAAPPSTCRWTPRTRSSLSRARRARAAAGRPAGCRRAGRSARRPCMRRDAAVMLAGGAGARLRDALIELRQSPDLTEILSPHNLGDRDILSGLPARLQVPPPAPHMRTKRWRMGQALERELREHPKQAWAAGRAGAAALLEGVLRAGEGGAGAAGADQAAFPYLIVRRPRLRRPHILICHDTLMPANPLTPCHESINRRPRTCKRIAVATPCRRLGCSSRSTTCVGAPVPPAHAQLQRPSVGAGAARAVPDRRGAVPAAGRPRALRARAGAVPQGALPGRPPTATAACREQAA